MKKIYAIILIISLIPGIALSQTLNDNKDNTSVSNNNNNNNNQRQSYYDPLLVGAGAASAANMVTTDNKEKNIYIVLEGGSATNQSVTSGDWAGFDTQNNSGGTFGATLGYREIFPSNWLYGFELSIASSSGSSSVTDCCSIRTFDSKMISGVYLTAGRVMGPNRDLLAYALLGVGSTKADSITSDLNGSENGRIKENGNGFSMGLAAEYKLNEDFGIRLKAIHNFYKAGEIDELRIRDTVVTGGLVISF